VGSARDLAKKIGMFVKDRSLLAKLRPDPREVRGIEATAADLEQYYKEILLPPAAK